jgi:cytochrome c biogenesis protein CcmG, thiol:disulfide interchange protein DsbE
MKTCCAARWFRISIGYTIAQITIHDQNKFVNENQKRNMTDTYDLTPDEKPKNDDIPQGITRGTLLVILGIVVVLIVMGFQFFRPNQIKIGSNAPDYTLRTFDGDLYTLEASQGQIILLNFWGNWCAPCHAEAPDLQDIHEEYADDGVLLLGVNYIDVAANALEFIERYGITYPNGPDVAETIAQTYNLQSTPQTYIIGRDGKLTHIFIGQVNYEMLAEAIESLLAQDVQ